MKKAASNFAFVIFPLVCVLLLWWSSPAMSQVAFRDSAPLPLALAARQPRSVTGQQRVLASPHFRLHYPARIEQRDAEAVLRTLEAARSDVLRRLDAASLSFTGPQMLEVIIHDTTGDFVAATGQPWWAAAATRERRIELQPLEVLRRRRVLATTLRHEYAHTVIETLSDGRAPRWLAEGLALHVAGEGAMLVRLKTKTRLTPVEIERGLARPASAQAMRALYAAAYREVQALIRAKGEAAVWRHIRGMKN